ncbi:MAG: molybdate ABC transporter substrate-binding protein [Rhodospirillaceae bacterium]|jgi:molybdate transport system substrate-binding protein|nr:molybdate ABC transporter substrate-binding protein [Rhodospirillaceae bacterium]
MSGGMTPFFRNIAFSALTAGMMLSPDNAQAIDPARILVLSAASAAPAIQDLAAQFSGKNSVDVRVSIGSSGTLARQISQGVPADIYVSAAPQWIDVLQAGGRLDPNLTRPLARNRLVLVGPIESRGTGLLDASKPLVVLRRLDGGRLAIGDPSHVPAGRYAKEAIETLGLWPAVRDRLALQSNVRAVLAMVERGETPLGIVYATDAALSDRIRLAAIIPPESHSPIIYTAAVLVGRDRPDVTAFFQSMLDADGQAVFERYGFGVTAAEAATQSSNTDPSMP